MVRVKHQYHLQLMSELHDRVKGVNIFTKLGVKDEYYVLLLKAGGKWMTVFHTWYGWYE